MANYKTYIDEKNRKVVAVCRYAGRKVKAVAKCAPEDTFNSAYGMALAIARCKFKVAKLKLQNATEKYKIAAKEADNAAKRYDKMKDYYIDSVDQLEEAGKTIQNILKEIQENEN